jgi:hypothetical protein
MTPRVLAQCATIGILIGLGSSSAVAQCRAADAQTANMLRYVQKLVTAPASDSEDVAKRQNYHLPAVAANQVTLVSTSKTCKNALAAYTPLLPAGTPAPTSVYVVAAGNVYVVWVPAADGTEWALSVVFDSHFNKLASFTA